MCPHKLIGSDTVKSYGFVLVVWPCFRKSGTVGAGCEISFAQDTAQLSQLSLYCLQYAGLSNIPPAQCLPACYYDSCHDDNELNI